MYILGLSARDMNVTIGGHYQVSRIDSVLPKYTCLIRRIFSFRKVKTRWKKIWPNVLARYKNVYITITAVPVELPMAFCIVF